MLSVYVAQLKKWKTLIKAKQQQQQTRDSRILSRPGCSKIFNTNLEDNHSILTARRVREKTQAR